MYTAPNHKAALPQQGLLNLPLHVRVSEMSLFKPPPLFMEPPCSACHTIAASRAGCCVPQQHNICWLCRWALPAMPTSLTTGSTLQAGAHRCLEHGQAGVKHCQHQSETPLLLRRQQLTSSAESGSNSWPLQSQKCRSGLQYKLRLPASCLLVLLIKHMP
jgi:hypothetical protein